MLVDRREASDIGIFRRVLQREVGEEKGKPSNFILEPNGKGTNGQARNLSIGETIDFGDEPGDSMIVRITGENSLRLVVSRGDLGVNLCWSPPEGYFTGIEKLMLGIGVEATSKSLSFPGTNGAKIEWED